MTKSWSIALPPGRFKRRFEEGNLVLWRPGLTAWIAIWGNDRDEPMSQRLDSLRAEISPHAYDFHDERARGLAFLSYRLAENAEDGRAPGLYGFAVGRSGHVQMAVYFDMESELETARAMLLGLRELQ